METKEDFIELMKCINCKNYSNGICNERKEKTKEGDSCSYFDEIPDKKNKLNDTYNIVKEVLKEFIDTKEENYDIITLWIIGTWIHKNFETYPYLFINAMKGSGKTRVLKLIKELSCNGDMLASLSEAVLFRTTGTLCIDEFEGVGSKDKTALRELLNTAYKKGGKVKRMRKKKTLDGEEQVVEEFDTFRPVVMANIWGMEEVLGDRCISIILEKSSNTTITRKIENFSTHYLIKELKENLLPKIPIWCSLCSVVTEKNNLYDQWNTYISSRDITTHTTYIHITTLNYTNYTTLFNKVYDTNINGRNLELTFPLMLISEDIGILDKVIKIIKDTLEEKREEDVIESKDIMLYDFVSRQDVNEFRKINELTGLYKSFINYDVEDEYRNWLNSKWLGRALKRLNLVREKRRIGEGIQVILNIEKAKEKIKIFKKDDTK